MPAKSTPIVDRTAPIRSVTRPNVGESRAAVPAVAGTSAPTCHLSTSKSAIRSAASTPNMTWGKVATAMVAAVTAAREARVKGRIDRQPRRLLFWSPGPQSNDTDRSWHSQGRIRGGGERPPLVGRRPAIPGLEGDHLRPRPGRDPPRRGRKQLVRGRDPHQRRL